MIVAAATVQSYGEAVAVIVGCLFVVFDKLGLLHKFGLVRQSAVDAAAELGIAETANARLQIALDASNARVKVLEQERTNEPVLAVLAELSKQLAETARAQQQNADSQAQVIERLAKHNGSFAHMEKSLKLVVDGLKALMGTIAELHDIPMKQPMTQEGP